MTTRPLPTFLLATALSTAAGAQEPPSDAQCLAAACNAFAADLHGQLGATGSPVCSPGSIAIALLMLLPGARGETATELATVLHLPADLRGDRLHRAGRDLLLDIGLMQTGSPNRDVKPSPLVITNDLWVQAGHPLLPAYTDLLRSSFAAGCWQLDFRREADASRQFINAHIARATNDRIRELLQPDMVPPSTRVVLTNALWFKAGWENPFWDRNTKDAPFTLTDGTVVQVPTMQQSQHCLYAETEAWQCVSLAFADSTVTCEILVPRPGTSLAATEHAMLARSHLPTLHGEQVRIELPRFAVTGSHGLKPALAALGLRAAFDPGRADFTGITTDEPLVIDDVVHQAWIQVDEEGAEAAAATAIVMKVGSKRPDGEPKLFRADHPFAFGLRDRKTGLLLFVGRVTDPRGKRG